MYTQDELLEQFGVADEFGEIVIDRVALTRSIVERGVNILNEIDVLKNDSKELLDEADVYGLNKSELKDLIKYTHKNTIVDEIDKLEGIQSRLDNLNGVVQE